MNKKNCCDFFSFSAFKVLLILSLNIVIQSNYAYAEDYRFGVVPQFEARRLYAIWSPILEQLEDKTGHHFTMLGAKSISEFERNFAKGDYDFAYMNPWHSVIAHDKQGYYPIIRDGVRKLKGILVANKSSAIKDLSQLDKQRIAFPSPNALGASLLMRTELKTLHGINIKPVYVGTHSSVYLNVMLGQTMAGGGVIATFNKQNNVIQDGLDIIYQTREILPHPISAHPRVSKQVVELLQQAFLDMKNDNIYQQLLKKIPMAQPVKANIKEYQPLKKLGLDFFYVKQ